MAQLHYYLSDALAKKLQARAKQGHLFVSKYLALMIERKDEKVARGLL